MDAVTKLNPNIRVDRLKKFIDKINYNTDSRNELESWKMSFDQNIVKCNALVLKSETIQMSEVKN